MIAVAWESSSEELMRWTYALAGVDWRLAIEVVLAASFLGVALVAWRFRRLGQRLPRRAAGRRRVAPAYALRAVRSRTAGSPVLAREQPGYAVTMAASADRP